MKKLLTILLIFTFVLTLTACPDNQPTTGKAPSVPTTSQRPTEKPTTAPMEPTATPTAPTTQPTEPTTPPTEPAHTHVASSLWSVDKDGHWKVCQDCGEILDAAAHTLVDDCCSECNAEVYVYDDWASVYLCNEFGDVILSLDYEDGILVCTQTNEYTYDNAGNLLTATCYTDGQLSSYAEFLLDDDGFSYVAKETNYNEDGSYDYNEYDQWFNNTLYLSYDADGTLLYSLRTQYTCDDYGTVLYQKAFENDVLTYEMEYAVFEDEDGYFTYCSKEIEYFEDGSKLITEYNELGDILSQIAYDADGNPIDNRGKFDPVLCAPLFGTWQGSILMPVDMSDTGMEVAVTVIMTFDDQGNVHVIMEYDYETMRQFTIELFYGMYEGFGISREEADNLFLAEYGMTVEAYVDVYLQSEEGLEQLRSETQECYYVEGDQLYIGSWDAAMDPATFHLDGDTLTIYDSESELDFTLSKVV